MDVSVVVLTYNSEQYLKQCLDSVFKETKDVNFEVIVVDNQSQDKTVEVAKTYGDKIKLIIAPENGGYPKGNNLGIKASKGKFILIMNPDLYLVENSIERLFLWINAHDDCAIVGPDILTNEQKISSYANASFFPSLPRILTWAFFLERLPGISNVIPTYHTRGIVNKETYADWVSGSFLMVRRQAIEQVGMLDENIFMYGDEVEWCMRFKKSGWKVAYTPITKVVHIEGGSQGGSKRGAILGEFKGLKYIYGKHYPEWQQVVLGTILDMAAFLRVLMWLVRLKPEMVKIYLEALLL